jgi:hypothetical protein
MSHLLIAEQALRRCMLLAGEAGVVGAAPALITKVLAAHGTAVVVLVAVLRCCTIPIGSAAWGILRAGWDALNQGLAGGVGAPAQVGAQPIR